MEDHSLFEYAFIDTQYVGINGSLDPRGAAYSVVLSIKDKIDAFDYARVFTYMVVDLDCTNLVLSQLYLTWEKIKNGDNAEMQSLQIFEYNKLGMIFVHDIKCFIDKIIGLFWCHEHNGSDIWKVEEDGIGKYLNSKDKSIVLLKNYEDFFTRINDIDNAFKHSIINLHNPRIGVDAPCICVNYCKYNDYSKKPDEKTEEVKSLVGDFNKFYDAVLHEIGNMWK